MKTKLGSLQLGNVEGGRNNFRKTDCKVAEGNIGENAVSLVENGRGLYYKSLSDRSYVNKRKVREVEKALEYELRRNEMETEIKLLRIWKM